MRGFDFLRRFWNDDHGALIATEWVFIATILIIGLVTGLKSVQTAVLTELEDVANAIGQLNQSYSVGGSRGCCSFVGGSRYDSFNHSYNGDTCTEFQAATLGNCPD